MIALIIPLLSCLIGAFWAASKNRNPFLWGVLCFLLPLIGQVLLAVVGDDKPLDTKIAQAISAQSETPASVSYDKKKWDALVEFDEDIRNAAETVRPYGQEFVDRLADRYLSLNDKSYLPNILTKLAAESERAVIAKNKLADFNSLAGRAQEYYNTPSGKVVILHDRRLLAEVGGDIKSFDNLAMFRKRVSQPKGEWLMVTGADRVAFVERFAPLWPAS
jgi:hypothetical protein